MKQTGLVFILFIVSISVGGNVLADDVIKSAMTAAPTSISAKTTVMDWNFKRWALGNVAGYALCTYHDTAGKQRGNIAVWRLDTYHAVLYFVIHIVF